MSNAFFPVNKYHRYGPIIAFNTDMEHDSLFMLTSQIAHPGPDIQDFQVSDIALISCQSA